jgi:hypothetical protein
MELFAALEECHSGVRWHRDREAIFIRISSYPAAVHGICEAYNENRTSLAGRVEVPYLGVYELSETDMARLSKIVGLASFRLIGPKPWWFSLIPRRSQPWWMHVPKKLRTRKYTDGDLERHVKRMEADYARYGAHYRPGAGYHVYQSLMRPVQAIWVFTHPNLREIRYRRRLYRRQLGIEQAKGRKSPLKS